MKRILFFIESLSGGGAEKVLVTLLKHLDCSQYEVTVMSFVDTGVFKSEIDKSKVNYLPVINVTKNPLKHIWNKLKYKLIYQYIPCGLVNRWIIPQKGIDIYVAFTEGFSTKLLSYSPGKKVAWVHADLKTDSWTQKSHIYNSLEEEQLVYQRFNKVVCVSKSVEQVMKEHYHTPHTMTIYNPVDTEDILQKVVHPSIEVDSTVFNIVSVGRLVPQKGFDRLIAVTGKLIREGKDVKLYIIGEGCERKHLESIVQKEGLHNIVHLMGFMSNPFSLMSKMNLFVCSSRAEGYSLAIAEAMVLGLPIVSTLCAGPNDLLEDGKYGMLVYNNTEAIYNGLCQAIDSPMLLEELRNKSMMKGKTLGVERMLNQVDELINKD